MHLLGLRGPSVKAGGAIRSITVSPPGVGATSPGRGCNRILHWMASHSLRVRGGGAAHKGRKQPVLKNLIFTEMSLLSGPTKNKTMVTAGFAVAAFIFVARSRAPRKIGGVEGAYLLRIVTQFSRDNFPEI